MRNPSVAFQQALIDAPTKGIVPRWFALVRCFERDTGSVNPIGVWSGDENVSMEVLDGQTGVMTANTFYGLGSSMKVSAIPRVSDLTIQTINIQLPSTNPIIQTMVRERSVRFVKADVYVALMNPDARLSPVGAPEIAFLGEVDGDPIDRPVVNGEGSLQLNIVSDAIRVLSRTNPAVRSDAAMRRRVGNDSFGRYNNSTQSDWAVTWGEK